MYAIRSYYADTLVFRLDGLDWDALRSEIVRLGRESAAAFGALSVITSYSIHYTKLYEMRVMICMPAMGFMPRQPCPCAARIMAAGR